MAVLFVAMAEKAEMAVWGAYALETLVPLKMLQNTTIVRMKRLKVIVILMRTMLW